jgi:hypothetical protein
LFGSNAPQIGFGQLPKQGGFASPAAPTASNSSIFGAGATFGTSNLFPAASSAVGPKPSLFSGSSIFGAASANPFGGTQSGSLFSGQATPALFAGASSFAFAKPKDNEHGDYEDDQSGNKDEDAGSEPENSDIDSDKPEDQKNVKLTIESKPLEKSLYDKVFSVTADKFKLLLPEFK